MITSLTSDLVSPGVYRLTWSSDVDGATFYVYLDGELIGQTSLTEWNFTLAPGDAPVLTVVDDLADAPTPLQAFPGWLNLTWYAVAGAEKYLVQEYIGGEWVTQREVLENGDGYYLFRTRYLEDSTVHQFQVLPVGTNQIEGTAASLSCLMVRHPDPPNVTFSYDPDTGAVTIAAAA